MEIIIFLFFVGQMIKIYLMKLQIILTIIIVFRYMIKK